MHVLQTWLEGALIQDVMPNLHSLEREWLITSITPEQWTDLYEPRIHATKAPPGMIAAPMDKVQVGNQMLSSCLGCHFFKAKCLKPVGAPHCTLGTYSVVFMPKTQVANEDMLARSKTITRRIRHVSN
jgi:hypothetical protein